MATTIEMDLKEILGEFKQEFTKINQRLDRMEADLTTIKVDVATVKTTVNSLENRLEKIETEQKTLIKDMADLKGAKSLIIPIIVAVTTSLITLLIRAIPNP
jgi:chromosome segregation ATPase